MRSGVEARSTVIAGAGLVGSLWAIYLARAGRRVTILERRPDMRREMVDGGRSINLAVSARGLHALREVGLEEALLRRAVPMRGRMIHAPSGELAFQRYGVDDSECIYSISRAGLNQALMTAAEATGQVEFRFRTRVESCDFSTRTVSIADEASGSRETLRADQLFGTDGAGSAVRQAVTGQPGGRCAESPLDYGYKELVIPPIANGGFAMEPNALHIWPRGTFMLIALPNFDGSFTVTLFLPFEGPASFSSLQTPEAVDAFFARHFADARSVLEKLTSAFASNPTGRMVTVKCAPWNLGEWALLLGDAAHAIVPFFGQGMNCGFEDCSILARMLDEPAPFAAFSEARKPDADAIADLAVDNFVEMRDRVGNPAFLLQKEVEKRLEKAFPGEYLSRYRLVTFHRVPYRKALAVGAAQDDLLTELCAKATSADDVDYALAEGLIRERLGPLGLAEKPKTPKLSK